MSAVDRAFNGFLLGGSIGVAAGSIFGTMQALGSGCGHPTINCIVLFHTNERMERIWWMMSCSCAHTARVRALPRTSSHVHCVKSRRYIVRLHVATVLKQHALCVTEIGYGLMWILTLTHHTVAVHLNLFKHMRLCTTCVRSCERARGSV